jgi:DNA-directed RNA polymerase subunit M/transcription elongation factor TFIIS
MSARLACPQCKNAFVPATTAPGSEFACPSCGKIVRIAAKKKPEATQKSGGQKGTVQKTAGSALPTAKKLAQSKSIPTGNVVTSDSVAGKDAISIADSVPTKSGPISISDSVENLPKAKISDSQQNLAVGKTVESKEAIPKAKPLAGKKTKPPAVPKKVAKAVTQDSVQDLPVAPLVTDSPKPNAPIPVSSGPIPVGETIPQEPSSGGAGFSFAGGESSSSSGGSTVRRRPKNQLPIPLIAGVGVGAVVLIIALFIAFSGSGTPATVPDDGDGTNDPTVTNPTPRNKGGNSTPTVAPVAKVPSVDLDSVQRQDIWERLQHSVVRVEADGPNGKKSALGFMADGAGWFVTNHHIIDRATKVTITTTLNQTIEAVGIVAANPAADLVIIAVPVEKIATGRVVRYAKEWKGSKGDLVALSPTNSPTSESILGYSFRETLTSTKLPPSSKALLREFGMDADNEEMRWIAFDGQVKDARATGGPLVNEQGHLIGVLTVLSPSSTSGYAIPVSVVAELVDGASNDVTPFGDNEIASNGNPNETDPNNPDPNTPDPNKPDPNEPDPNTPDPNFPIDPDPNESDPNEPDVGFPNNPINPPAGVSPEWSAEDIELVFKEGKEFQWDPSTVAEYASLQRYAGKVYRAYDADNTNQGTEEERLAAQKVAKDSINQLMAVIWKTEERVENVNSFAAEEMKKSNIGVLAYCEVLGQGQLGAQNIVLMKLTGEDAYIAVPVNEGAAQFETKSRWVVLGVPRAQQVNFQGTNNVTATMVDAYHVIGRNEL